MKSAEVDILVDGSLDYPDDLLKELDYTVCSIHSRFGLGKTDQTNRILRAMDNRYFNILGHATGRSPQMHIARLNSGISVFALIKRGGRDLKKPRS